MLLMLLVPILISASSAMAASKLSPDLPGLSSSRTLDIIVQFRTAPADTDLKKIAYVGGKVKKVFKNIPGGLVTVSASALATIAADNNIAYISPDRTLAGSLEFAEPTVRADIALQYGWTGSGIGVAVIDSGIAADHLDLKPRVVYSESFVPGDSTTDDLYGHGTHVAGIVGGNGTASTGPSYIYTFRGIAPKSKLINLRALDANGRGTDSAVISAIDRAISLKSTYGIRVINLSLGRTISEGYLLDPLCQAVQRAWANGIVVIVAAGNNGRDNSMGTDGYSTIASPGNSPYAITVGAMKDMSSMSRADDLIASYSSKGPTLLDHIVKPDLVAPGNSIVSALAPNAAIKQQYPANVVPVSYYRTSNSGNSSYAYFRLSGTSMAAPMVSGAAALLLEKEPSLTPDQVKARLMKTAGKNLPATSFYTDTATGSTYQSTYDVFTVGAGYLDVWAALSSSDVAAGSALSPRAVYNASTGNTDVVIDPGSVWTDAVIWGTAVVWGTNVIMNDTAVVWGTAVIWGTANTGSFAVIWGSAVIWGTNQPFPEAVAVRGDK
jgi:serine protease AprX